jgi:hypothetical protein
LIEVLDLRAVDAQNAARHLGRRMRHDLESVAGIALRIHLRAERRQLAQRREKLGIELQRLWREFVGRPGVALRLEHARELRRHETRDQPGIGFDVAAQLDERRVSGCVREGIMAIESTGEGGGDR